MTNRDRASGERFAHSRAQWAQWAQYGLIALLAACGGSPEPAGALSEAEAPAAEAAPVTLDPLSPESTDDEILEHLLAAEQLGVVSVELSRHFPDLDRERAYAIQRRRLERKQGDDPQIGWKIGWSRQTDPRVAIDPAFGHMLTSNVVAPGTPAPTDRLVDGRALVEAEVAVWLDRDLPGPGVTREDVLDAVAEVGGAIELLSPRVGSDGDGPNTHNHGIVDNVFHIGVRFGETRRAGDAVEWADERVSVEVNGEPSGEGRASSVLGRDPVEGVVWLANELLEYGYQLRAGDVVITGTVVTPPPIGAGDTARLSFSTLGSVELAIGGGAE